MPLMILHLLDNFFSNPTPTLQRDEIIEEEPVSECELSEEDTHTYTNDCPICDGASFSHSCISDE